MFSTSIDSNGFPGGVFESKEDFSYVSFGVIIGRHMYAANEIDRRLHQEVP